MQDVDGCHLYVVNVDPADPDGIWIYEAWRSAAHHQASLEHEAVIALISAARPLIGHPVSRESAASSRSTARRRKEPSGFGG